jgi:hypothetical protein
VAGLAGEPVSSPHELVVGDDAGPDAGAERDAHGVAHPAGRSGQMLAPGGARGVVVDPDRQAEPLVELVADPHTPQPRQVGADAQDAVAIDQAGDAHPHRADLAAVELAHHVGHGIEHGGLTVRRRHLGLAQHHRRVIRVEDHAEHLGAPHVDAGEPPATPRAQ